jgi:riboflavin kinase/FMN adenylyltransferase
MGVGLDFDVHALGLVGTGGAPARDHEQVSSTFIRRALAAGELDRANGMLGRPYEVRGTVEHGDGRGRAFGFPMANVGVDPSILLPADGVYACYYERPDAGVYPAAVSLGSRSHVSDQGALLLEAHLLDLELAVESDLHGEAARVRFVRFLRPRRSFDDPDDRVAQLQSDLEATRAVVA